MLYNSNILLCFFFNFGMETAENYVFIDRTCELKMTQFPELVMHKTMVNLLNMELYFIPLVI